MKKLVLICCWVCAFNYVSAQTIDTLKKVADLESAVGENAVYVIDGKISDKKIDGLDPNDILNIDILKKDTTSTFEGVARHNTVIITTKGFAIFQYQKKLKSFSDEYKNYLKSNKGNDSKLVYLFDGRPLDEDDDKKIKFLYDIPQDKIQKVIFENVLYKNMLNNKNQILIIITK
ncbi:hypothetical protein SNE25_10380 [Mucilaginibacter sabulilitoris]|uniref:TonB-dependent receptor n=1 Tax=Mucilaginibacter sabulilitoris TaxID=1173583 RepID=A0ABZ0TS21_9SPHI|nr:hypothetical protein [Mucilaginibacter sabulilitoris]WPU95923.1 hypothetical protein SNE25_10380 [Mucilaginibacter sabulilitoris]